MNPPLSFINKRSCHQCWRSSDEYAMTREYIKVFYQKYNTETIVFH